MKVIAFRRDPTLGIIYIIMSSGAGGMLIFDLAFAQSPLTIFTAVLLLAFAGSSTWLFKTPFAHISAGKVNINYSITERKNFLIANLKQAKRISKKKIELTFINGSNKVLDIDGMHPLERDRFFNRLKEEAENTYLTEISNS